MSPLPRNPPPGRWYRVLYAGLNDCQAGRLVIEDPLIEYEQIGIVRRGWIL